MTDNNNDGYGINLYKNEYDRLIEGGIEIKFIDDPVKIGYKTHVDVSNYATSLCILPKWVGTMLSIFKENSPQDAGIDISRLRWMDMDWIEFVIKSKP